MSEPQVIDHRSAPIAEHIVRIQGAAYRIEADLIGWDEIPNLTESVDDIVELSLTLLGIVDAESGDLVAFVGYTREADTVDIDRLAVSPDHHRRGYARTLLDAVHEREHSARRFEVSTGAGNQPALALYGRLAYEVTGVRVLPGGLEMIELARTTAAD